MAAKKEQRKNIIVKWNASINPTNKKYISIDFEAWSPVDYIGYTYAGFDLTRAEHTILKTWAKSKEITKDLLYGLLESFCEHGERNN